MYRCVDDGREIGKRVRARREEFQMTQEELAIKIGMAGRSSICKIETGSRRPSLNVINKLSDALNCDASYFIEKR